MLGHGKKKCLCLLTKGEFLMPRTLEMNFLFPFVSFNDGVCVKSGRPTGVKYGRRHKTTVLYFKKSLYKLGSRSFMFLC